MKTTFYKQLSIFLLFLIVFATVIPAVSATSADDYTNHWAKDVIQSTISSNVTNGYPDGTFQPNKAITRAEFIALVNRTFEFTNATQPTFTDVSNNDWYAHDIAKAHDAGYINGYPDGSMRPNDDISRQEVAAIISRLKSLVASSSMIDFADAASFKAWSKPAIAAVEQAKIMVGYPDGSFQPTASTTRAEALATITRAFNYEAETVALPNQPANPTEVIPTPEQPSNPTEPVVPVEPVTAPDQPSQPVESVVPTESTEATLNTVDLGMAGNFVILAKTGISTVPTSVITGDIGVSPIAATGITGFSLIQDPSNQFAISDQVTGKVYSATYSTPTPTNLTTAVSNMESAYTDAAGRAANFTELYSGDLSGKTLEAGVYKWGTGVLINSDITLNGGANDIWIFQIGEGLTQANGTKIILSGGAQANNIFWQVADSVSIGTGAHFEGNILSQTNITMRTNSSINGRLLAQTAVTLDASTVVSP